MMTGQIIDNTQVTAQQDSNGFSRYGWVVGLVAFFLQIGQVNGLVLYHSFKQ
jgi:hypothetical protein